MICWQHSEQFSVRTRKLQASESAMPSSSYLAPDSLRWGDDNQQVRSWIAVIIVCGDIMSRGGKVVPVV